MLHIPLTKNTSKKSRSAAGKPHPKTQFTPAEDAKLTSIVQMVGEKDWDLVSQMMATRNPRQCRERYVKYLSPDINKSPWTADEDKLLVSKFKEIGAKWVKLSKYFNNRTDAALKNRWNVLKRRERALYANYQSSSSESSSSDSYEEENIEPPKPRRRITKQQKVNVATKKPDPLPIEESATIPSDFNFVNLDNDLFDFFNSELSRWPLL